MKLASWSAILAATTIISLQGCVPVIVGAGVGAGVLVAEDRRSSGIMLEDQVIERNVSNLIAQTFEDQVSRLRTVRLAGRGSGMTVTRFDARSG